MADIEFVEVIATGPGWNKVKASDGNVYTLKGDYNWRSNNPGNIEYGPFAISQGAIGTGHPPPGRERGFAIFPTYEAGEKARTVLQFESPSYKDKTISQAISRYAPEFENDSKGYANAVAAAAGVSTGTKMSELTDKQRKAFLAEQRRVEGFRPGKISGEAGKPVPANVVRQFSAKPTPAANIGPPPVPFERSAALTASQQATPETYGPPPLPIRRPTLPTDRKPLPLPSPLTAPMDQPAKAKTAKLSNGNTVEIGKVYRIGDNTYVGGVDANGTGTLQKSDPGILKEAGKNTIVGGIVDATVRQMAADGARQMRPATGSTAKGAMQAVAGGASKVAGAVGNLASGPSAALASALERLGKAAAAKKGPVTVADVAKQPTQAQKQAMRHVPSSSGSAPSPAARLVRASGVVNTGGGMAGTAQMPRNATPSSVLSPSAFKPTPKQPTQAQKQAINHVPQYLTKTREVPVEPKQIVPAVSLDQTVRLDKYGIPTGQVGFAPPSNALSHKPTFRTETYQVPNPAYTEITVPYKAPAGPSPAQIEAARLEELRRIQAAYEAQKRAEMEAQKKQVKYLSNTNAEHRAALESGSKGYVSGGGTVMPTKTVSGKVRNSYGDSGGSLVGGGGGKGDGANNSGVSWW